MGCLRLLIDYMWSGLLKVITASPLTRTALVINEKHDCKAPESNLIKQQDFHKMSLKSIGQYGNHLRRCKYDKLWFSSRRQWVHVSVPIMDSTGFIILCSSNHCCQELLPSHSEFRGFTQISRAKLGLRHPSPKTHSDLCSSVQGSPGDLGSEVTCLQKPWLWSRRLSVKLENGIIFIFYPCFPVGEHSHLCFKLFCPWGKTNTNLSGTLPFAFSIFFFSIFTTLPFAS